MYAALVQLFTKIISSQSQDRAVRLPVGLAAEVKSMEWRKDWIKEGA